jgi:uncharacterized protein YndB with AHSA1/START domain
LHVQWQGISAQVDPIPGGDYIVHMSDGVRVRGRFLEVETPSSLVIAWGLKPIRGRRCRPSHRR